MIDVLILFAIRYRGFLILLVLGHQIVHVGLGLGKLLLVHALTSVPVQEGLTTEHGRELITHTLEELLDRGRVAHKGR